jgi:hypothetical protein
VFLQRRKVALISADFSVLTTWATIFALGKVAQMVGLYRDAVTCYGKSANMFHGQRNPAREIEALRSVRDLYMQQGMKEQTKIITFRLLRLESKRLQNEKEEE